MDDGWLAGVSYCKNLKTLRLVSCKVIDGNPGLEEHLGFCIALERAARDVVLQDCWGLDDCIFSLAVVCRRVKLFDLEGRSLLTTDSLESVIESWKELECLRVVSCKNIKDSDISPALATLFTTQGIEMEARYKTSSAIKSCGGKHGKKRQEVFQVDMMLELAIYCQNLETDTHLTQ
ncbi:F-box protein At5g07670-like [Cicer arietinum]|uniref:F-box protein At5g07670-like n=1 Tax=Cicer arietinum TaxID=3827 RepID=A0A1S3DWN5_CICAR|nr:F-box protein At5g07670-like [Cicer arietinum]